MLYPVLYEDLTEEESRLIETIDNPHLFDTAGGTTPADKEKSAHR